MAHFSQSSHPGCHAISLDLCTCYERVLQNTRTHTHTHTRTHTHMRANAFIGRQRKKIKETFSASLLSPPAERGRLTYPCTERGRPTFSSSQLSGGRKCNPLGLTRALIIIIKLFSSWAHHKSCCAMYGESTWRTRVSPEHQVHFNRRGKNNMSRSKGACVRGGI